MQTDNSFLGKFRRTNAIHFIGIGGVGMSGIAEVLLTQGYKISGSDLSQNASIDRLQALGADIYQAHHENHVRNADVVVTSSAIADDNIEVLTAKALRIPIVPRAQMLAELMRFKHGIAVAGTHGKTTTTSLIATLLAQANYDPTFVIGGRLNSAGANARLGDSKYFVAEADESDASFLHLTPMVAIVTNIDNDHLNYYRNDFATLQKTFLDFLQQLPFYGLAIICRECPHASSIINQIARPTITYGLTMEADYFASNIRADGLKTHFRVNRPQPFRPLEVTVNLPGEHNVLNAVAAITVATEEGVTDDAIAKGLNEFQGIGRRFQFLGDVNLGGKEISLIDDYGHHPNEIMATISAARSAWPTRRIMMIFQPHRYSRTEALFDDFVQVLSKLDMLIMLEVYTAGETHIPGADSRALCRSIRQRGKIDPILVEKTSELIDVLKNVAATDDVVLLQGAGSVSQIAHDIYNSCSLKRAT